MSRIVTEVRRRGVSGFVAKGVSLLFRPRAHVLFELPCERMPQLDVVSGERIEIVSNHTLGAAGHVTSQLIGINPENADYLDDVRRGRMVCIALLAGDRVVHYGFMFRKNRTACLLGLPSATALIGNAYTVPEYRGTGCQGRSVLARARVAREEGFSAVAAETSPDNIASQRGMQKAGMVLKGRIDLVVVLNCLVIRWRRPPEIPLFGVCLR